MKFKRHAFTIIEIFCVLAILAILMAMLIPIFGRAHQNAMHENQNDSQTTRFEVSRELHPYLGSLYVIKDKETGVEYLGKADTGFIQLKKVPNAQ